MPGLCSNSILYFSENKHFVLVGHLRKFRQASVRAWGFERARYWGRFSTVPKLYGQFSGVTVPFVTQERMAFHSYFSFCYFENMLKDRFSKTSGWQFHRWLFGPKTFSGLSRNGPQGTKTRGSFLLCGKPGCSGGISEWNRRFH